jgi:hypothetical protein
MRGENTCRRAGGPSARILERVPDRRHRHLAATPALALVATLALSSPALATTLVRYEKSGGIAGIHLAMTVTRAGTAQVTVNHGGTPARHRLTSRQVSALKRDLRDARFSTLKALYKPGTPVADGFTQTVRYAGRTVTVRDGGRPPARLSRLLARLSRIAANDV